MNHVWKTTRDGVAMCAACGARKGEARAQEACRGPDTKRSQREAEIRRRHPPRPGDEPPPALDSDDDGQRAWSIGFQPGVVEEVPMPDELLQAERFVALEPGATPYFSSDLAPTPTPEPTPNCEPAPSFSGDVCSADTGSSPVDSGSCFGSGGGDSSW